MPLTAAAESPLLLLTPLSACGDYNFESIFVWGKLSEMYCKLA